MANATCPLCATDELRSLFDAADPDTGTPFSILWCQRCDVGVTSPPLSDEELASFYPADFYGQVSSSSRGIQAAFLRARRHICRRALGGPAKRVLDFGAGDGTFLDSMRQTGADVVGVEVSAEGRKRAAARGIDMVADLDDIDVGHFDLITAWHVIEHIPRPLPVLERLVERLSPTGKVILAVPNFASVEARLFRDSWFHLDVPRHQVHFTPTSFRTLAASAGLQCERVRFASPEYGPFGILQSALNALTPEHRNALYHVVKRGLPLSELDGRTAFATKAALALLPVLGPTAMAAEMALAWRRRSGSMTIVASLA